MSTMPTVEEIDTLWTTAIEAHRLMKGSPSHESVGNAMRTYRIAQEATEVHYGLAEACRRLADMMEATSDVDPMAKLLAPKIRELARVNAAAEMVKKGMSS